MPQTGYQKGSQNPRRRVDLRARGIDVAVRLRKALSAGTLGLPEKTAKAFLYEATDIQKVLTKPTNEPRKSVFPAEWLQVRWDAILPEKAQYWYPYFDRTGYDGTMSYRPGVLIGNPSLESFLSLTKPVPEMSDHVLMNFGFCCTYSVLKPRGHDVSTASTYDEGTMERVREFAVALSGEADPLWSLPFMRRARAEILTQKWKSKVNQRCARATTKRTFENGALNYIVDEYGPQLLLDCDNWRLSLTPHFRQAGSGSMVAVQSASGVSGETAISAVHLQRLSLLLAALALGNAAKELDWESADYADFESKLREQDLSDLSDAEAGSPSPNGETPTWEALAPEIEAHVEKGKGEQLIGDESWELKAWLLRKKTLGIARGGQIIISAPRASEGDITKINKRLTKDHPAAITRLLVVGSLDGSLRLINTRADNIAAQGAIYVVDTGLVHGSALDEMGKLLKQLGRECPPESENPLFDLATRASIVDPYLAFCWLGLQNLHHTRTTEAKHLSATS